MAPNPRRQDARLEALYEKVPEVPECDGSCYGACCFIENACSVRERQRLEEASGLKLVTVDRRPQYVAIGGVAPVAHDGNLLPRYTCSMLDSNGRCTQYDLRPMICRLYGAAEGIECERGCKPSLGLAEGMALLADAMQAGGDVRAHARDWRGLEQYLADEGNHPEFKSLLGMLKARKQGGGASGGRKPGREGT